MKLSNEIVTFAAGNTDHYVAFADYFNHFNKANNSRVYGAYDESVSLAEKADKINKSFFAEVERLSGVKRDSMAIEAWASNPSVRWAAFAVIDADVMAVLPDVVNRSIGLYTDLKYIGVGDVAHFRMPPHTMFTVSRGGRGERTSFRQLKAKGDVFVSPIEHIITTYVDMYEVLAGKADLAQLVTLVVMSLEADMANEATTALTTGMAYGTYPAALSVQGTFDAETLVKLGQTVQAYNFNIKPIILGTATALMKVLPDSTLGYRMNVEGADGDVRILKGFYNFDLVELPQIATGRNYGLALADDTVYVLSPATDKLVKGAISNSLTNSNQFYDNGDLSQNYTMRKNYGFTFASSAVGGMYKITG